MTATTDRFGTPITLGTPIEILSLPGSRAYIWEIHNEDEVSYVPAFGFGIYRFPARRVKVVKES